VTLLDRILARAPELPADPIMAARIERHLRRMQPDPLFRRRLRSVVVNRYVAAREGLAIPVSRPAARRQMGVLGRGVLYASMLTALGVTAVGAASQGSLPGDALYAVKLGLEQVRMQMAPPGLRDDLAAVALDARLDEVEQLATAGRWELVGEAAGRATAAEATLEALAPGGSTLLISRHAERLTELMATAPASALDGLRRALAASTGALEPNGGVGGENPNQDGTSNGGQGQGPQSGSNGPPHEPDGNGPGVGGSGGNGSAGNGSQGGNDSGSTDGSHEGDSSPSHAAEPTSTPSQPGDGNGSADGDGFQGGNGGGNQQ
jgi:hypothetical protein